MFKGLRTKIESEQKDQGSGGSLQTQPNPLSNNIITAGQSSNSSQSCHKPSESLLTNASSAQTKRVEPERDGENGLTETIATKEIQPVVDYPANGGQHQTYQHQQIQFNSVDQLRAELSRLQEQLKSVIKERDDSNDQNGQLYQLIEKLRRNLESEKETSSNLQVKLEEAEKKIAETSQTKNEPDKRGAKQASSAKSFNPSMLMLDTGNLTAALQSSDIDSLKKHVMDLQGQITDKSRQLKIRQQNLNDIKRTLQMEISEHAKTQEELSKVQNQLKQANQISSANSESLTPQNGSSSCDIESIKSLAIFNNNIGTSSETRQSLGHSEGPQETTRVNESLAGQIQFDNISCISRSSNSVDENDLHDHSSNREINNEYLKNVLYRYMTSTDTETAKHLVKALSVMMNFTPEQTAAIKSVTNARSSWLRLK